MLRRSWSRGLWGGIALGALVMFGAEAQAQSPLDGASEVVKLWPDGAPGAKGTDPITDVPALFVFKPSAETATGAAMVVCPGGGYGGLADDHEGREVAEWLNSVGVTTFVLRYRLAPNYREPAMMHDVNRAIRVVRQGAEKWKIDPQRVGLLGFSAGGHLASTGGTHFDAGDPKAADPVDRVSSRPDRLVLVYQVVAMATPYTHKGSNRNLLGENPSEELLKFYSNEQQVTKETPPTFLAHTNADAGVPAENSILFALALRKAGVPMEMHVFEKGQHGLGLGRGSSRHKVKPEPSFQVWPKLCETWLKNQGFLDRKEPQKP